MCGIAGFVTGPFQTDASDHSWFSALGDTIATLDGHSSTDTITGVTNTLQQRFADMMSIGFLRDVATDPALRASVAAAAGKLEALDSELTALSRQGRTDLDPVIESVRDYAWQLKVEVGDHATACTALVNAVAPDTYRALNTAITAEYVLRAIDKLEVRGRDSAGIVIQIALADDAVAGLDAETSAQLTRRTGLVHGEHLAVFSNTPDAGGVALTFVYKTANLVGRLGDNGASLRGAIAGDTLLWALAGDAERASILSHTRWASHGVISVANCHPHNASLEHDGAETALGAMYALNGDVDNHIELLEEFVHGHQMTVHPAITTDAKVIPLADRLGEKAGDGRLEQFRSTIRRLDGSVAIGCVDPTFPGEAFLAQKGSGQGLRAARVRDGWMFASEVYGLANASRESCNLSRSVAGGSVIHLDGAKDEPVMLTVNDGNTAKVTFEPIQIFARDIYRGDFDHFLEKEINDGPSSVAKTIKGRYRRQSNGFIAFDGLPNDIWAKLRETAARGISRVYVIGQGTAGVAAVGIAHLIEKALWRDSRRRIPVQAVRSSELSADIDAYQFKDALVIAVSQSGTTTDTNRAVDLVRERGAVVHAVVNRRNSDLVRKADSVLFTSDGRDVEMSVASTKAFYSQITAGKLTALFLADQLETMTDAELAYEMGELERLPQAVQAVLDNEAHVGECARSLAPYSRYWAVTGSGVNHIAALEIRIKLSELCYKSIPVDFTEDKKHIDLSTEPLTLVVANDLPSDLVGDVVKEAAIFKAHNGRPVVFATEGADAEAFGEYAERVIALPAIGGDMAFVLATVAGHLFGFHAARAIDEGAQKLKTILAQLNLIAMRDASANQVETLEALDAFVDEAATGAFNSGLGGNDIAEVALLARSLRAAADDISAAEAVSPVIERIRHAFEETSRPVDTIRHQAKTVTVGTSRPEDALSAPLRKGLAELGLADSRMTFDHRKTLAAVSRLVNEVRFVAMLDLSGSGSSISGTLAASTGPVGELASYGEPTLLLGTLGAAMDENEVICGFVGNGPVIVVPVNGVDYAQTEHLLCIGVDLAPHASREQKIAVMKALGTYKPKLREWQQSLGDDARDALERQISRETPVTVVFRPTAIDLEALEASERQSA
ncbi:MAG: SIS domain-containing protein [Pseudomonadota bacterium]